MAGEMVGDEEGGGTAEDGVGDAGTERPELDFVVKGNGVRFEVRRDSVVIDKIDACAEINGVPGELINYLILIILKRN